MENENKEDSAFWKLWEEIKEVAGDLPIVKADDYYWIEVDNSIEFNSLDKRFE